MSLVKQARNHAPSMSKTQAVAWKKSCEVPWAPPDLDEECWHDRTSKRNLAELAGFHVAAKLGANTEPLNGGVTVTIKMYRTKRVSKDELRQLCRPFIKALVRLGWAKDDSEKYMRQIVLPTVVDRKNPRTVISIEYGSVR